MKKTKITAILLLVVFTCVFFAGCSLFNTHTHNFDPVYQWDENGHWRECTKCDKRTAEGSHEFGTWQTDTPATATASGLRYRECKVCHYREEDTIPPLGNQDHDISTVWSDNSTHHWHTCSDCDTLFDYDVHVSSAWIVETSATATSSGLKYKKCTVCQRRLEEEVIPPTVTTEKSGTVDLYAINDFHGEHAKLAQISGYISDKLDNGNTVAINSGDMFQGSMESNWNYGSLFADCMNVAGFDAFTYGNHEFDWGLDNLRTLVANNGNVPFLGANIYKWNASNKTWGDFADDLAQKYVIKELDNGLRVGIIGVIGSDQITSISSQLVQTIGFKDPLPIIKELATELRNDKACDVVVVSVHAGPQDIVGETENKQQPSSSAGLSDYVDAVFCAHTHVAQNYTVDGIPFIQGGSNGNYVSHVQLSVDNGNVTCTLSTNVSYNSLSSGGINTTVKNQVQTKIDNSNKLIEDSAKEVLTNLSGGLSSSVGVPRLVCHAMANYAVSQGYDIQLAMTNNGRSSIGSGDVTYTSLYEAVPFDNVVYVAEVSGADLYKMAVTYSYSIWRVKESAIENSSSKYYKIAVIDYLLYHQNSSRNYNYFSSAFSRSFTPVALTKVGETVYNYRLITRDFLKGQTTVNANLYSTTNDFTDNSKLTQVVDLSGGATVPTEPTHAGTLSDPYSVADAILLASGYTDRNSGPAGYLEGYVSNINNASKSSTSGDLYNFYLTDDNGNKILIYYVSKFNGATSSNNWTGTSDLKNGDHIVMYAAHLFTYNSTTPETYNGYVVSINGVATA